MTPHAATDPAAPSAGPGAGFGLLTPADWYRIPLRPGARRAAAVKALVERQFAGVDDQPVLRRKVEEELLGAAGAGAEQGGVVLYLSFMDAAGVPLSASLLVSVVPRHVDPWRAAAALPGETAAVDLPAAGRAARRRRVERGRPSRRLGGELPDTIVEYAVPVPGRGELLLLTFSTPLEPLADAMVELFDAVAATLRWPRPAAEGVAG